MAGPTEHVPIVRHEDDLGAIVARLGDLARRVLVLDFDGTLSPIVDAPGDAALADGARDAVAAIVDRSDLEVAVLSGRHVDDLLPRLDGLPVLAVGGHGSEAVSPDGERTGLVDPPSLRPTLDAVREELRGLVGARDGWLLEEKPHSIAVHYRRVEEAEVAELLPRVRDVMAGHGRDEPGWDVLDGKAVVELRPQVVNKGEAIRWISSRYPGRAPVVVGDDVTDEEAFAAARDLGGDGVVVSDRPRPTAARWRLTGPDRVVELLGRLSARPTATARAEEPVEHPIEEYGLISDSRTGALVSPDGSIDWLCLPRFDAPSVFAALLDPVAGGRWRIRPRGRLGTQRTYLGETNVLVTRFVHDGDPVCTLTDLLVYSRVNAFDPTHTGHQVVRRVEAFAPVSLEIEFQPRFDYARARTEIDRTPNGVRAAAGTEWVQLRVEGVNWDVTTHDDGGQVARGSVDLEAGDELWFVMVTPGAERGPHRHLSPPELLDLTVRTWGRWSGLVEFEGPWREAVVRSALTLKGLVYEPTGALVAAPTTSLPESLGGERNWDYRYAWIRDSAYVLECFLGIGHAREAETFIRWLSELTDHIGGASELRPLYRITGEEDLTEFELGHLAGYRGSRPVRVGNGAAMQLQLDIYGAAMQLGYLTVQQGTDIPATRWEVIRQLVDTVTERWRVADSGIWEIRSTPRHHVVSRFQCWLAIDRAIRIGRDLGLPGPYDDWRRLAGDIADDLNANGFDEEVGAYVQSYGSRALDASALLLPLRGFLPATDERVRATVAAVRRDLEVTDGLLLRYRTEDGLTGDEGAFLLCSFWLVELLARMGDLEEAERLFDRLLGMAGPLLLYGEEIDPSTHHHLGNFPQGFTHMGLIMAAIAIEEARGAGGEPTPAGRSR